MSICSIVTLFFQTKPKQKSQTSSLLNFHINFEKKQKQEDFKIRLHPLWNFLLAELRSSKQMTNFGLDLESFILFHLCVKFLSDYRNWYQLIGKLEIRDAVVAQAQFRKFWVVTTNIAQLVDVDSGIQERRTINNFNQALDRLLITELNLEIKNIENFRHIL